MQDDDFLEVEIQLNGGRVRLMCPHRQDYIDEAHIDEALCRRLLELEHAKKYQAYGRTLFEATFPAGSETQRGLFATFDSARKEERRLRLRLNLEPGTPPEVHGLHWELLNDGRDFELGRSPETVFSRYVSQPSPIGSTPLKARLLCVIAAPTDGHRRFQLAPIDYHLTARGFEECLAGLHDQLEVDILERPVTPERLRDALKHGGYHFLHFHGHGMVPRQGEAALVLEDDNHQVHFTPESAFYNILLGLRQLKLVTLVACHGAAPSSQEERLSGMALSLVRRQIPAVIAMRRAISMDMGYKFTKYLYQHLAQDPHVDAAVNEARQRLYMEKPDGIDWSSPILYMRLEDGLLWPLLKNAQTGSLAEVLEEVPGEKRKDEDKGIEVPHRALALLFLLLFVLGLSFPALYLDLALEPIRPYPGPNLGPNKPNQVNNLIKNPPPPAIQLQPITTGKIGIGVVRSNDMSWNGSVARTFSRRLRELRSDLQVSILPESLHGKISAFYSDDLSVLPGGERSPEGFEFLLLVLEKHGPLASATGPLPGVSVQCELVLIETRGPSVQFAQAFNHTGMAVTEAGALEQAFERCLNSSQSELP